MTYQRPEEAADRSSGGLLGLDEEVHDAGEATILEMVTNLGLEEGDRMRYLFDYGDEWRFYAVLKEFRSDDDSDGPPEVVKEKGEPVIQYPGPGEEHRYRK